MVPACLVLPLRFRLKAAMVVEERRLSKWCWVMAFGCRDRVSDSRSSGLGEILT